MLISQAEVRQILTRTSGYLNGVTSHSLQPYRGCAYGNSLCGVGCYVQHNPWLTRGEPWGSFLEVRRNAADAYVAGYERERRWARANRGGFGVFLSSSTDPFPPQERRYRVTGAVLDAMRERPPDVLIVHTHSHLVCTYLEHYRDIGRRADVRVHISIESDRDRLPGLPPPASSVDRRLDAAAQLREAGVHTVIAVAPLLPIADPEAFFARIAACADAVILDHFVGGDGSADGARTRRTSLPQAMAACDPTSVDPAYRDRIEAIARRHLPGRVGVGADGFAGRMRAT